MYEKSLDEPAPTKSDAPREQTRKQAVDKHRPIARHPEIERIHRASASRSRGMLVDTPIKDLNGNGLLTRSPRVSVVVPARNEARNLPYVFERIPRDVYEIVLVDGDSTDSTADVARSLRHNVRVIGQERPGKGNALICGFNACRGDIIVMIDADGSMDAGEIPRYVAALVCGADFVKGSRYMQGGGSSDITRIRSFGNRTLTSVVNRLFGTRYSDLCYGYSAFWRWTLPHLQLDTDGFEIETLMNIRARTAGLYITEVASFESPRIHGNSNLSVVRDGLRIARTILAERASPRSPRSSEAESKLDAPVLH
ncbi:MAG: glycosyltransferase family 2 protein [Thermoleophilaceae bacterium]|nr:glycosyltransferase family 2 protein [Thermoleophilaceae bacterium]